MKSLNIPLEYDVASGESHAGEGAEGGGGTNNPGEKESAIQVCVEGNVYTSDGRTAILMRERDTVIQVNR